jgi:hypothetical protein
MKIPSEELKEFENALSCENHDAWIVSLLCWLTSWGTLSIGIILGLNG